MVDLRIANDSLRAARDGPSGTIGMRRPSRLTTLTYPKASAHGRGGSQFASASPRVTICRAPRIFDRNDSTRAQTAVAAEKRDSSRRQPAAARGRDLDGLAGPDCRRHAAAAYLDAYSMTRAH